MYKNIISSNPYVIAEIGANHNGNFKKACYLIESAKKANCDAVKFQSWDENLNSKFFYKKNPNGLKSFLKYKLSFNQLAKLRKLAKKLKINFGTTPFSNLQLKEAVKLKCDFIKVASMDLNNFPFLEKVSDIQETVIISTGFSNEDEIKKAAEIFKRKKKRNVIFLHCVGVYPPRKAEHINMNNLKLLKDKTGYNVGFSDHTIWPETCLVAASLGAKVIERHFTYNKKAQGWDHSISADFLEMKNLVISLKRICKITGKYNRQLSTEEIKKSRVMRRSITIKKNIPKNIKITPDMLDLQRPGTGIAPKFFKKIINKKSIKKLFYGNLLNKNDFK